MSEEILNRLLRTQTQMLAQQSQILGAIMGIAQAMAEAQMRLAVVEAHIERKEKGRA